MTRKRFVKLAMSYGVQRNEAERMAAAVAIYGSYEDLFVVQHFAFEIVRMKTIFRRLADNILRAVRPVMDNLAAAFRGIDWP